MIRLVLSFLLVTGSLFGMSIRSHGILVEGDQDFCIQVTAALDRMWDARDLMMPPYPYGSRVGRYVHTIVQGWNEKEGGHYSYGRVYEITITLRSDVAFTCSTISHEAWHSMMHQSYIAAGLSPEVCARAFIPQEEEVLKAYDPLVRDQFRFQLGDSDAEY